MVGKGIRTQLGLAVLAVFFSVLAQAGPVGYQFDITTEYKYGGTAIGGTASPDTGFLTVVNSGASTFTGTISLTGKANAGTDVSGTSSAGLAPTASLVFASGSEGSNQGGFNVLKGLLFHMVGTVSLGLNSEAVDLQVYDKDIHSGSPRNIPCGSGASLDNYVLQGGTPGCDAQDAYETTQAKGHFQFFEAATGGQVPEPGSMVLLSSGLAAVLAFARRFRK